MPMYVQISTGPLPKGPLRADSRQSIFSQSRDINPAYRPAKAETTKLRKRNKSNTECGNFALASSWDTKSNHDYLDVQAETCSISTGPNVCTRLACINTSAVYLCNDNDFAIEPACNYLATYIEDIVNTCHSGDWTGGALSGQEFDTDGYNVVVGKSNHCVRRLCLLLILDRLWKLQRSYKRTAKWICCTWPK